MTGFTAAKRFAILGGARSACATAAALHEVVEQLRSTAELLRRESSRLRLESATVRGGALTAPPGRWQPD